MSQNPRASRSHRANDRATFVNERARDDATRPRASFIRARECAVIDRPSVVCVALVVIVETRRRGIGIGNLNSHLDRTLLDSFLWGFFSVTSRDDVVTTS